MGGSALSRPGPVRLLIRRASEALDLDLEEVIRRGGPALRRTEAAQPALLAVSLGLALEFAAGRAPPVAVAGHSVGEVAAFAFAGALEPEAAVDCVVARARLMAAAARRRPGRMAAVHLESQAELEALLQHGSRGGLLSVAAHNAPGTWVLAGDRAALDVVASHAELIWLPVSGPWHTEAMREAAEEWRRVLARVEIRPPEFPLAANGTGTWVSETDDVRELLAGQLTGPVRWVEVMQTLAAAGSEWHVFGPGRVLQGLCRANLGTRSTVHLHGGAEQERVTR
jgi:[acyl-carrier-protein] S-malonyltransferase